MTCYLDANKPKNKEEVISFCEDLFKFTLILEELKKISKLSSPAEISEEDISKIKVMIDNLKDKVFKATNHLDYLDLVDNLYDHRQVAWYRETCIYLGYAFDQLLKNTGNILKCMKKDALSQQKSIELIEKFEQSIDTDLQKGASSQHDASSQHKKLIELMEQFEQLIDTDLRKMPVLFSTLAAVEIDRQHDKLSNRYIAVNNQGYFCYTLGLLDEAEKYIKCSIELNPFFPLSFYNLGMIYHAKGQLTEATEALEKAKLLCRPRAGNKDDSSGKKDPLWEEINLQLDNIKSKKPFFDSAFSKTPLGIHKLQDYEKRVNRLRLEADFSAIERYLFLSQRDDYLQSDLPSMPTDSKDAKKESKQDKADDTPIMPGVRQ